MVQAFARIHGGPVVEAYSAGSRPELVAKTVSRALKTKKTKTRYVVGKVARPLLFLRKWFGDRIFDRVVQASS